MPENEGLLDLQKYKIVKLNIKLILLIGDWLISRHFDFFNSTTETSKCFECKLKIFRF